jgi:hypothetical protein
MRTLRAVPVSLLLILTACASCSKKGAQPTGAKTTGTTGAPSGPAPATVFPPDYKVEHIQGDGFTVTVASGPAALGAKSQAVVEVRPKGELHLNHEFPTELTLTAPAGVELGKAMFEHNAEKNDAATWTESLGVFQIAYTPREGGEGAGKPREPREIAGLFKFAVCTANSCDPKETPLAIAVISP